MFHIRRILHATYVFLSKKNTFSVTICSRVMERLPTMDNLTYDIAVKKAQLVERNPQSQLDPLRVSMHDESDIIALAQEIQNADKQLKNNTCQKLAIILDQIRMLQSQALNILKESEDSRILHSASCNFMKKPGNIYHLYQKPKGQAYFSMLSPEEWNHTIDQVYKGSYRLEFDLSWTPVEKIKERDENFRLTEKCIENAMIAGRDAPMAIDLNVDSNLN